MQFYLVLTTVTAIIFFLSWKIWKKTRDISFLAGIFMIYYWTLLGAWFIVYDELTEQKGKNFGLHYYYLLDKMFPVHADHYYMKAILLYALFIFTLLFTILFSVSRRDRSNGIQNSIGSKIIIRNNILFLTSIISIISSFVLVYTEIKIAIDIDKSIYTVVTTYPNRFYTLHQIFNLLATVPLFYGFVTYLGKDGNNFTDTIRKKYYLFYYLLILGVIVFYLVFLGNKHALFYAGLSGFLFYIYNVNFKIKWRPVIIYFLVIGLPLMCTDTIRSFPPSAFSSMLGHEKEIPIHTTATPPPAASHFSAEKAIASVLFSNEIFGGHFSMYGVLSFNVPFTYGSSLVSLLCSLVPKVLWPDRPPTIYEHYVNHVHAVPGQGYSINHATAWYLNFGIPGIIIGALVLGFLWSFFYNKLYSAGINIIKHRYFKLIVILGMPAVTAQIMNLIRSGPEGYKPLLFEALIIPAAVLFFASQTEVMTGQSKKDNE